MMKLCVNEGLALASEEDLNLSDFALFLAVMKNKAAHTSVLSIIMEEPDLELKSVHVEEVVLNHTGKRAIRLDARAVDVENRQFATEMQNDANSDDLKKRARYYQSLLDSPILKSGKRTRYRQLPPTFVTFITQEDIFGRDLAKYTFTEQCEEIAGLKLADGTTKIFLNMSSQNGNPVLVSLLQYMKKTQLDNPNIIVKDERILKLDAIVNEVKESEEWEAVRMSILSVGIERGMAQGMAQGIVQGQLEGRTSERAFAIIELLEELGPVPEELRDRILKEQDLETLKHWFKKAARAKTILSFEQSLKP